METGVALELVWRLRRRIIRLRRFPVTQPEEELKTKPETLGGDSATERGNVRRLHAQSWREMPSESPGSVVIYIRPRKLCRMVWVR